MNQELKDRIEDVRANILLEQPFYGTILSHIPLVEDESIDTAATDGRRIIYSPEYMGLLKGSEIKFILLHELLHILLLHFSRRKGRDRVIWNIATDYVINMTLRESGYYGPDGVIYPHYNLGWEEKSAEVYYDELYNSEDESVKKMIDSVRRLIEKPEIWRLTPSDLLGDYEELSPEEEEVLRRMIKDAIKKTVDIGGKPPEILSELYFTKPKNLSWESLLREYLQESEADDSSYLRPERKYLHMGMIVPGADPDETDLGEIWAFIDTSGSISQETVMEFLTQLKQILSSYTCSLNLAYWDSGIGDVYKDIQKEEDLLKCKTYWGGGTDVACVYKYIEENRIRPYLMLILTDGYFDDMPMIPKSLQNSTIMVLSGDCGRDMRRYGKVARLQNRKSLRNNKYQIGKDLYNGD